MLCSELKHVHNVYKDYSKYSQKVRNLEKRNSQITYWNVPVPKALDKALEEAIQRDWHRTKAEFIRELVRRELERRGYKPPTLEGETPHG